MLAVQAPAAGRTQVRAAMLPCLSVSWNCTYWWCHSIDNPSILPLPSQVKAQSLAWGLYYQYVPATSSSADPIWTRAMQARPGTSKAARDFTFRLKNLGQTQSTRISDLDFRFQISDLGFQILDFRFWISEFGFQSLDFIFEIEDFIFQVSDFRLQTVFKFLISDSDLGFQI